jgi:hypothetical protein
MSRLKPRPTKQHGAAGVEVKPSEKNAEGFFDFVVARPKSGRGKRCDHSAQNDKL